MTNIALFSLLLYDLFWDMASTISLIELSPLLSLVYSLVGTIMLFDCSLWWQFHCREECKLPSVKPRDLILFIYRKRQYDVYLDMFGLHIFPISSSSITVARLLNDL